MKIFYDGAIFSIQRKGGINRYLRNLIQHLPPGIGPTLLTEKPLNETPISNPTFAIEHRSIEGMWPLRRIRRRSRLARKCHDFLNEMRPDVIHPSYYDTLVGPDLWQAEQPIVVTVHDFIHERFADQLKHSERHIQLKRQAIERADHVICVSEHTRQDLLKHYPIPEQRTSVVYHASTLTTLTDATNHPVADEPDPTFLFVGGRHAYKGFALLVAALKQVRQKYPNARVACVGAPLSTAEKESLRVAGLLDAVTSLGFVDDKQLVQLYRSSYALVYPSLYEGFGLPPLEAMEAGAPVICSDSSSIPEVVGSSALMFRSGRIDELSERMMWLLADCSRRDPLIASGKAQAKKFSWTIAAEQTAAVYQHACSSRCQSGNTVERTSSPVVPQPMRGHDAA